MMDQLLAGSLAGFTATIPMTVAMEAMYRRLPPRERYPLYPWIISQRVAAKAGVERSLDPAERIELALVSHFGYGTAAGAVYGLVGRAIPLPLAWRGAGFGLALWAGGYLGWLPALGILRPATEHPPNRRAMLVAAHVVWGLVTGILTHGWATPR